MGIGERAHRTIGPRLANVKALALPARLYFRHSSDHKIASYRDRIVHHSYGGHRLAVSLEDPVAEDWYDHDWPLIPELACLQRSRLRPGARVFDVGAHQCVLALILARLVGPAGQVVAVEAERHNFEVAVRNKELNGASNLECLLAAGGAGEGSLYFRGGLNGAVAAAGRLGLARVAAVSVDGLAERYGAPDVVLIDVEGYEQEVLRGATRTLAGGETDFFVEVHVGHGLEGLGGSAQSVIDLFDPKRFQCLVSPAASERDEYEFRPLQECADVLGERFFMICLARSEGHDTATSG